MDNGIRSIAFLSILITILNDKIVFLTDGNPESLYPYYVIKDINEFNSCAGTCVKCDREAAYLRNRLAEIPLDKQKIPIFDLEQEV